MRQSLLPIGPEDTDEIAFFFFFLYFMDSELPGMQFSHSQGHLGATYKVMCPFLYVAFLWKKNFC